MSKCQKPPCHVMKLKCPFSWVELPERERVNEGIQWAGEWKAGGRHIPGWWLPTLPGWVSDTKAPWDRQRRWNTEPGQGREADRDGRHPQSKSDWPAAFDADLLAPSLVVGPFHQRPGGTLWSLNHLASILSFFEEERIWLHKANYVCMKKVIISLNSNVYKNDLLPAAHNPAARGTHTRFTTLKSMWQMKKSQMVCMCEWDLELNKWLYVYVFGNNSS